MDCQWDLLSGWPLGEAGAGAGTGARAGGFAFAFATKSSLDMRQQHVRRWVAMWCQIVGITVMFGAHGCTVEVKVEAVSWRSYRKGRDI